MDILEQLITALSVVIVILTICLILILTYVKKRKRSSHTRNDTLNEEHNIERIRMLNHTVNNNLNISYCGDIMSCTCPFNVSKLFMDNNNNNNHNINNNKNTEYIWKEGEIINETFNCEIRKVDLFVVNRQLCTQHSGGVIKKLNHRGSWNNEYHIYQLPGLRHENILLFLDAFKHHQRNQEFRFSLITAEASCGSLYSYLMSEHWADFQQYFAILQGIVTGLTHLHSNCGLSKPSVVHRDLKSKNILLKTNFVPCIADFGLAIPLLAPPTPTPNSFEHVVRVGTQRYMAPEILEGTIGGGGISGGSCSQMSAYLASDVYALALVLWEIMTQCPQFGMGSEGETLDDAPGGDVDQIVEVANYCLPYTAELRCEMPSLESMIDIVCVKKLRPQPEEWWLKNKTMFKIWSWIEECWEHIPEERISASLILERLKLLEKQL